MAKQIYILLIAMLGFFLTPTLVHACGKAHTKTEKPCCSNKKTNHQTGDNNCCGACGHSSCHCSIVCYGCTLPSSIQDIRNDLFIASKKQFFFYINPYLSSGFRSIWQPPKIG